MGIIQDINEVVCGNNYKICYKDEKFNQEIWVYGEVVNYGNSGVIILDEEKLIQIPHRAIVWMLPNGLTRQKKEKMAQKAIDETVEKIKEMADSVYNLTGKKASVIASKEIMDALNRESLE